MSGNPEFDPSPYTCPTCGEDRAPDDRPCEHCGHIEDEPDPVALSGLDEQTAHDLAVAGHTLRLRRHQYPG